MKKHIIKLMAMFASAFIGITGCGTSTADQSVSETIAVSGTVDIPGTTEESTGIAANADQDESAAVQVSAKSEGKTGTGTESNTPDNKAQAAESTAASQPAATPASTTKTAAKTETTAASQSTTEPVATTQPAQESVQQPAATAEPAAVTASQPVSTAAPAPVHTHTWNETGRSESTDCFSATTTTTITYACSCGETKDETSSRASGCNWDWVGEWEHDYSGCIWFRWKYHTCTVHGTTTMEMPQFEEEDRHNYVYNEVPENCEGFWGTTVICSNCGTSFPDMGETHYGTGHDYQETGRRELDEDEKAWFGKNYEVTMTCTKCGASYTDVTD